MPEDDDLNYPLLNLLLLATPRPRLHHHGRGTALARRTPRGPHLHRRTHRLPQPPRRHRPPAHRPPPQPVPRMDRRPDPRRRPRLDQPRRPGHRGRTGLPRRHPHPHRERRLRGDVHRGRHRRRGHRHPRHPPCLRTGLTVVPPAPAWPEAVRPRHPTRHCPARLRHGRRRTPRAPTRDHHWVHAIPNTALLAAALTHADGDFTASICRAVSGGWDTDSNGATAGSIAGLLAGSPDALPDRWTAPLKNRLATSVARLQRHRLRHPRPPHPPGDPPPMTHGVRPRRSHQPPRPRPRHPLRRPARRHDARRLRRRGHQGRAPARSRTRPAATARPRTASACGGSCWAATSAP